MPELVLRAIGLPLDYEENLVEDDGTKPIIVRDQIVAKSALSNIDNEKRIAQIAGNSLTIDWSESNKRFDRMRIDTCHEYEAVKKDSEDSRQFLEPGSMIIWYGYEQNESVSEYVNDLLSGIPIVTNDSTRSTMALGIAQQ